MVRCPNCGNLNRWSVVGIQPCNFCGMFIVMPSEEDARAKGVFDDTVVQPYTWEVTPPEATLLFDGIDCLMDTFQEGLQAGDMNDAAVEMLSGSYVFAKMTRERLRRLVPDLQEEVEKR